MNNQVTRETPRQSSGQALIKKRIMRQVYTIWFVRRFGFLFFVGIPLLFFVSLYPLSHVSFSDLITTTVVKLSMFNISGFLLYVFVAVRDTQYTISFISLLGTLTMAVFLVKQASQEFSTSYSKRHVV
jgi:hypothetical protein